MNDEDDDSKIECNDCGKDMGSIDDDENNTYYGICEDCKEKKDD